MSSQSGRAKSGVPMKLKTGYLLSPSIRHQPTCPTPLLSFTTSCCLIDILVPVVVPTQVLLQSGPGLVAAGQQELRGPAGGAVHQPHRQLQDRRAGHRRSRGGQVGPTRLWSSSHSPHVIIRSGVVPSAWFDRPKKNQNRTTPSIRAARC